MATRKKPVDFEKSLADLESIVASLESGEMSLEQSLKAFEEGIKLTRECQEALQAAEQKVSLLLQAGEQLTAEPFSAGDDAE